MSTSHASNASHSVQRLGRENAQAKGRRYLIEGRLIVRYVNERHIVAYCRGDGAMHRLEVYGEDWHCSCPARGRCSHLVALGLVIAPNHKEPL